MKKNVLLVDDDDSIRFVVGKFLSRLGYGVKATDNPHTLMKWVKAGEGDVILTDVHMGAEEIFSFVPEITDLRPELPVIVISANTRMVTSLKSRKAGVFEYIPKPFDLNDVQKIIERALTENSQVRDNMQHQSDHMIGRSKAMQPVFRAISDYASANVPVFVWGAAGTGKNLAAQCVHNAGERSSLTFVSFAGLEEENLQDVVGSGDLFVDRVHELKPEQQAKLLRGLERNENNNSQDKFRVIATADMSLEDIIEKQMLRTDLLSHLMGGRIFLPPLRDRVDDIDDLATHFLNNVRPAMNGKIQDAALVRLKAHNWPGNVRELRNLMHVFALQFSGSIPGVDVIENILSSQSSAELNKNPFADIRQACADLLSQSNERANNKSMSSFEQALEWVEKPLITEALRITGGNNSKAADLLGIHRNTLRTKLRKWQAFGSG